MVAQESERLLLADEEAADAVGAVVDAGGVAAERDVAGELVDLVAEGETGAAPRIQRRAVRARLDRPRQDVVGVEERFEDRGAGARIAGMGGGIGWTRGTSLGEGERQRACPMRRPPPRDGIAPQDVSVDVVLPAASRVGLDPSREALRPQAPVDLPLVEVGALLPEQRRLCD